ncbi:MAG: N-6 DNA methylase [Pirellula sp.]
MNHKTELGSRIAQVHNGSSLFTGDAGQGESNIRRWLIENDWVEAIVALPLNLFYNTGIATYIWVLSNKKLKARKGKIQLIDATQWYRPLRKNLGKKNCELAEEDIQRIMDAYVGFKQTEQSKIFPNAAFGYWKVVVERPLRLKSQLTVARIEALRFASGDEEIRSQLIDEFGDALFEDFPGIQKALIKRLAEWGSDEEDEDGAPTKSLPESKKKKLLSADTWQRDARLVSIGSDLRKEIGERLFNDHNSFCEVVDAAIEKLGLKVAATDLKSVLRGVSWTDESAVPVIAKTQKPNKKLKPDPLNGLYQWDKLPGCFSPGLDRLEAYPTGTLVEFEPDPDLRDSEQIPLLEEGGIEAFIEREVLPYTPDSWLQNRKGSLRVGYEISFIRHFYKPAPLRTLDEIRADIFAVEQEAEGLLAEIVGVSK